MKDNSGITLISLVVTIIILGILTGITIFSVHDTITEVKDSKLSTELGVVRHAVTEQYGKAAALGQTGKLPDEEQVSFWAGEKITDFYDIDLPDQSAVIENSDVAEFYNTLVDYSCEYQEDFYYRLTPEILKQIGVSDAKDTYVVNYHTGEVYNETQKVNSLSELLYLPKSRYDLEKTHSQEFNDWE